MKASRAWIVLGLGLSACVQAPPPSPAASAAPARQLDWKREGQQLRLITKGSTSYLVVVTDSLPSAALSPGTPPTSPAPPPAATTSQAFGTATVDVGTGRAAVYALTPVLTCAGPLQCSECTPGGGVEGDCSVPPIPPPPGPRFARSFTVLARGAAAGGGGR
jgi:hypothetical protein